MPTSTEYRNLAREALTKASAAIRDGQPEQYDGHFAEYEKQFSLAQKAEQAEAAEKALQADVPDIRDTEDSGIIKTQKADEAKAGVKLGDGTVAPFADKDTEGWIKGFPAACQHPDLIKRYGPELQAEADNYKQAFSRWVRKGRRGLDAAQSKALEEGDDTEGGYVVPSDQVRLPFIHAPGTPGGTIRPLSTVFTTTRDAGDFPTIGSVVWASVAEEAALPSTTDPVFGQVAFTIFKVMGHHKVSSELLEDSAVSIPNLMSQLYGESLGRYEDQQAIEGDGTTEPQGIRTDGGTDSTGAGLIDASDGWDAGNITNLFAQLPAEYRGNATWHTTSTTLGRIWAVNNATTGGIHFIPNPANPAPAMTLMGRPVVTFDGTGWDTTLSGTNEYGCFADFRHYYFINRIGMSLKRLDELYAGNDQVGFVAKVRYDSRVAISGAFLIMKGEA